MSKKMFKYFRIISANLKNCSRCFLEEKKLLKTFLYDEVSYKTTEMPAIVNVRPTQGGGWSCSGGAVATMSWRYGCRR